jgi:hypothetical protein
MSWYARSLASGDVHQGALDEGRVRAACGLTFLPSRESGQVLCCELPEPERICAGCRTWITSPRVWNSRRRSRCCGR